MKQESISVECQMPVLHNGMNKFEHVGVGPSPVRSKLNMSCTRK